MTKKVGSKLFKRQGRMIDILLNLPEDKLRIIINEILDNAYHLIKDAELLVENHESFGHGFGLIALACEEIAKVDIVCLEKQTNVSQESKKDPLLNHFDKQESLAAHTFAAYIPRYLNEYVGAAINESGDDGAFNTYLSNFLEKIETDDLLRSRLEQRQYFFGRPECDQNGKEIYKKGHLSELREYSLYVDVIDSNNLITPKDITRDCATALKSICEEELYYIDKIYNSSNITTKYDIKKPTLPLTK